jgi:DNA-binding NarL/FixJ family response regulator
MPTGRLLLASVDHLDALDLQQRLTRMGHTVLAIATSSHEALHLAAAVRPDVVVIDLRLPSSADGLQAGTYIWWVTLGIPVIYVSAHFPEGTLQRLWPSCPTGLLGKGTAPEALHQAIAESLARQVPPGITPTTGGTRHPSPARLL